MVEAIESEERPRFSIRRMFAESYRLTFSNLDDMVRLFWFCAIANYAANFSIGFFSSIFGAPFLFILTYILQFLFLAVAAVAWHQRILSDKRPSSTFYFSLGHREWKFFAISILVTLLILGLSFTLGFLLARVFGVNPIYAGLLALPLTVLVGMFLSPFSLIYPRIAIGLPIGLEACWASGKPRMFRLYFGFIAVSLPLIIASNIAIKIPAIFGFSGLNPLLIVCDFVALTLNYMNIAVIASYLSLALKHLAPDVVRDAIGRAGNDPTP